ncbi:MAG: large subunit ribosomal protein L25 [Pseudohongiellaceae bacterium]|jgi:large subunit ribosomal protein L25
MSKLEFELDCSVRTDLGKGASRRLRRLEGNIPAVIYGGDKDPISLTIPHKDIYKAIQNEAFFAHIITLKIGKKKEKAVIKALQRHPAKDLVLHADFLRVNEKEAIQVRVPLHFINEEKCVGVKIGGGNIMKTLNEIEVSCLPKDLPEYIEVDMLKVELGANVHLSDIVLPKGVTSVSLASHNEDNDLNVAAVHAPKGVSDDEAKESAEGADGASGSSQD